MRFLVQRYNFLFRSTRGLALTAIAMISLVTAFFGMLSGPMAELGIRDFVVRQFGIRLVEAEREGRIIMLYHSIAMAVVAIETYFITSLVQMKDRQRASINATITAGYLIAMVFGLAFAYFGRLWVFHGLFIFGQSLVFFAGLMLAAALWPWRREHTIQNNVYAHTRGGLDLERTAMVKKAVATLGSAVFGAVAGSYFGNGFEAFLAEDVIRQPHKTLLQDAIIGHLHIMLTLIAIALTLIVGRWFDFKGPLHKIAMPLMIVGTIVISLGAWSVVALEAAHTIIYVGSVFVMLAALMLVIFGWRKLIREGLEAGQPRKSGFFARLGLLLRDPLRFGALWQMVFMNFTVSGVGIFMAAKLDEVFRVWPWREERIVLTGHWHILSGIIATILLLYYADLAGLQGRARRWFGWSVILFSDLAFASVTVFEMKRLFVGEAEQQPLVDTVMILADLGLAAVLVALALLMIWRLADLFQKRGRWSHELAQDALISIFLVPLLLAGCSPAGAAASTSEPPPAFETGIDPEGWARIPPGEFLSGQHEHPALVETGYEMMVTPVTNAQFARFLNEALPAGEVEIAGSQVVGFYPGDVFHGVKHELEIEAGNYPLVSLEESGLRLVFDGDSFLPRAGYENHPAVLVTWFGAKAYCEHYGWRLPTEIEWEKAARGTDNRPFPWGESLDGRLANYYGSRDPFERGLGKLGHTTPAGFYNGQTYAGFAILDSASPYDLYDMAGNVWQWTADVYEGQHYRYLRGGSKADYGYNLRIWTRNSAGPDFASPNAGFRCARDAGE